MPGSAEHPQPARLEPARHVPSERQVRGQGVLPTETVDELAVPACGSPVRNSS
jgi:hypothetical protein